MADRLDGKRWFLASLVVASRDDRCDGDPLVDLQFKLIRASDAEEAYHRALRLGAEGEHGYENADGERVCWEFMGLNDLHEIEAEQLDDGVEVYSRMTNADPLSLVVPKERLRVFWVEANGHRTATEILRDLDK